MMSSYKPTTRLLPILLQVAALLSAHAAEEKHAAPVTAPPRLAIVNVGGDASVVDPVADLLYLSFPTNPPVVLLERAEIDRLLTEQALSLWDNALPSTDAVQAGKIATVDAFLMLDTTPSPAGEQLRLRLVDTRYGLKLMDEGFLAPSDQSLLGEAAANIALQAARKLTAAHRNPEDMLLVSVGGFESVDLTKRQPWIADEIPYRLEQALQLSPQVLLLERRKTRALQEERTLVNNLPAALSGAALQIDGEHSVTKNGDVLALSITFRIRNGTNVVFTSTVQGGVDVPVLVREMVGQMAAHFAQGKTLPAMSPERESMMFAKEAATACDASRGLEMAEAALALEPENVEYLFLVVNKSCEFIGSLAANARERPMLYERDHDTCTRMANRLVRLATAAILRIPAQCSDRRERVMYLEYMQRVQAHVGALNQWAAFHRAWEQRTGREPSPLTDHVPEYWNFWNTCRSSLLDGAFRQLYTDGGRGSRGYKYYMETMFFFAESSTWNWCETLDDVIGKCQRRLDDETRIDVKREAPNSLVPYSTPGSKGAQDAPVRVLAFLREVEKSEDEKTRLGARRGLFSYSRKNEGVLDKAEYFALQDEMNGNRPAPSPGPKKLSWHEARAKARELFYEEGDFEGATNVLVQTLAYMPDRLLQTGRHTGFYRTILSDLLSKIQKEHAAPVPVIEDLYTHETLLSTSEGSGRRFRDLGKAQEFRFHDVCLDGNVATISAFAGTQPGFLQYDLSRRSILNVRTYGREVGQAASCLTASGRDVYMGFSKNGVLMFKDRETPQHLMEGNDLVSQNVHSLCMLGEKIYARVGAVSDDGLMELDPLSGRSRLLLNRLSRVPSCQIDGQPISGVAADEEMGALRVAVLQTLYSYDPSTGDAKLFFDPPQHRYMGCDLVISADYWFALSPHGSAYRISRRGDRDTFWSLYAHRLDSQLPYPMNVPEELRPYGLYRNGAMQLGDQVLMLSAIRNILLYTKGVEKPELIHDRFFEHYDRVRPHIRRLLMSAYGLLVLTTDELYLFPELTPQGIRKGGNDLPAIDPNPSFFFAPESGAKRVRFRP